MEDKFKIENDIKVEPCAAARPKKLIVDLTGGDEDELSAKMDASKRQLSELQLKLKIANRQLDQMYETVKKAEKTEAASKQLTVKLNAAMRANEAIKKQIGETKAKSEMMLEETKAKSEKKLEETKAASGKRIASLKRTLEETEAARKNDPEYVELKKKLKDAHFREEIDWEVSTKAYIKIGKLERDLEYAKMDSKNSKEEPKEDESKAEAQTEKRLKACSSHLVSKIESDIIGDSSVTMADIAGLEFAKKCVNELVVWPMSRPDIFTGLRALPRGLLLFGPPGTGKTMIGKAIANQSGATFFYISASSIGSKWAGESEQLVRTLFIVAAAKQPSVIFLDEIDSMLTKRSDDESGFRRAIKTEFMVQLDGMSSNSNDSILIIGATNCPHTLDEAIRRRFVKRMYIPLPATAARAEFMTHALRNNKHELTPEDFERAAASTDGFSCADMHALCTEAALAPVRAIADIRNVKLADIRAIQYHDFELALEHVKASVGVKDLKLFEDWNAEFGSFANC